MKCIIVNVDAGKGEYRSKILYAQLRELESDELLISATLSYILLVVSERKLECVNFGECLRRYIEFNENILRQ